MAENSAKGVHRGYRMRGKTKKRRKDLKTAGREGAAGRLISLRK